VHNGGPAGVGITFEPDLRPGSMTHGMHIVTRIRPNSPAHHSGRVQVGDVLAMIQQAGDPKSYPTAGLPISRVLAMLTGPPNTVVKIHILDGEFTYLPPKVFVCTRELIPTGITQSDVRFTPGPAVAHPLSQQPPGSALPAMMSGGSAVPAIQHQYGRPVDFRS